jgi:hypothetical protein
VESNKTPLPELSELLLPILERRLPKEAIRKLGRQADQGHKSAIAHLSRWLREAIPEALLDDASFDMFELVLYAMDLMAKHSGKDLAAILGISNAQSAPPPPPQMPLHLPHIDVPSHYVYHQVRSAVATKAFYKVDGTPYPTATLKDAKGHAQLKPLAVDNASSITPEAEENFAKLMWEQREELSDLDSDIWDYCNWKWLQEAESPEDYVAVTIDELLAMRGILKKMNGKGQRGGYKRSQKEEVLKSIAHLQNVWLKVVEFEVYQSSGRAGSKRSNTEAIQDRAIRIRESGQLDLLGGLQIHRIAFRPGNLFSRFLFGPGKQIALLSARALKYDLKSQAYEKRLARYLSWQWRVRASQLDYLRPYRVSTLVHAIDLREDRRFPSRTRDRLERALEQLHEDGVIRAWQYDSERKEEGKMRWLGQWLESTILVEPPQIILDRYQHIGQKRAELVDISEVAERLKEKRLDANLSILRAAEQSGVPPRDYLFAENGRRPTGSALDRLVKWLKSPLAC